MTENETPIERRLNSVAPAGTPQSTLRKIEFTNAVCNISSPNRVKREQITKIIIPSDEPTFSEN